MTANIIAVTLADACLRLPELIGLVAEGREVVIVQNGVVLAGLTAPPFQIPTAEEEAARRALAEELSREIEAWHRADGLPFPPVEQRPPEAPAA